MVPASKPDIESFTWRNLNADVYLGVHASTIRHYLDDVVLPVLDGIDARHEELKRSTEVLAAFELADLDKLRTSTIEAFVLSVQSIWERHFRDYVVSCAREIRRPASYTDGLKAASWPKLCKAFEELRGIPMTAFDSFADLDLLQLLGNACRHGDGISATRLHDRHPELWPNWPPEMVDLFPGPTVEVGNHPGFSAIVIPRRLLPRLGRVNTNGADHAHSPIL
ncbi:hypothetical protein ACQ858_22090 [Variovorax ureilyticus]|uniref:hypothetical protein n=1 Tax=Variovorax ureilyticus TaxID=1836198 RepID=UPI003D6708FF